jgi:copper chaperone for superoxide dismutase
VTDQVRGLTRLVQVSPQTTLLDVSVRGVTQGTYHVSIRQAGNISLGPESTGDIWEAAKAREGGRSPRGVLGTLEVGKNGIGSVFVDRPIEIWELIGRSMVVSKVGIGKFSKEDPDTLVGVIARSAGVWDNDKTVCSCTGKTVWEERKEQADRGML